MVDAKPGGDGPLRPRSGVRQHDHDASCDRSPGAADIRGCVNSLALRLKRRQLGQRRRPADAHLQGHPARFHRQHLRHQQGQPSQHPGRPGPDQRHFGNTELPNMRQIREQGSEIRKTAWILGLSALCCLISALPLMATIYYVSNSGDDTKNDGKSTSTPWKTMLKVQNSLGSLRAGDSVLFQRGGIWYESLDLSNGGSGL